jgi:hypothetical protein
MAVSAAPEPPENVRALMRDGRTVALDCLYVGVVDGVHTWEVAYPLRSRPTHMSIGRLPPRTTVVLHGEWRGADHP